MGTAANGPEETQATRHEEITRGPGEQPLTRSGEEARRSTQAPQEVDVADEQPGPAGRKSRRGILRKWLVGAAAAVGAGALLKANSGTAQADGVEGPTTFQTNDGRLTPLVKAVVTADTFNSDESLGVLCSGQWALSAYTWDTTNPVYSSPLDTTLVAVVATSSSGYGVYASSGGYPAVYGTNSNGVGVEGNGGTYGVFATSSSGTGVYANSNTGAGLSASSTSGTGILASSSNGPAAIYAVSEAGIGVHAVGANAAAVTPPAQAAVFAQGGLGNYGIYATNAGATAIYAHDSTSGTGVIGSSNSGTGVLAFSSSGHALIVNGLMQVKGSSVGQATIPAGASSVTVSSPAATTGSNVLLTPLGNPNGNLWVTRANGSFTINASAAQSSSLSIAYLIIN